MYAFQLPAVIPAQGEVNGPPLPADRRNIGGMPGNIDVNEIFRSCVRDPTQLQSIWDGLRAKFQAEADAQAAAQAAARKKK